MPFPPLDFSGADPRFVKVHGCAFNLVFEELHWLLASSYPRKQPDGLPRDFLHHSALGLVALIDAVGSSPFETRRNRKDFEKGVGECFKTFVRDYFPWGDVTITAEAGRDANEVKEEAIKTLYETHRGGLIHGAGTFKRGRKIVGYQKALRGFVPPEQEEKSLAEFVVRPTLDGAQLMQLGADSSLVDIDVLYWCLRKATEKFISDPAIAAHVLSKRSVP